MVLLKSGGYEGAVMHVTELDALLLSNEQRTRFETFLVIGLIDWISNLKSAIIVRHLEGKTT